MSRLVKMLGQKDVLLADGAMGTLVVERAARENLPQPIDFGFVVLQAPGILEAVHQDYVDAGAELLLTGTFSFTSHQLGKRGKASVLEQLLRIAADCARRAAGADRVVFGDLGPIGDFFPPMGSLAREDAVESYARRARTLAATGLVDGFVIETQYDLQEVECAVAGVRQVSDLPLAVSMSFDSHGRTMLGVGPEAFAEVVVAKSVELAGVNCGKTLQESFDALVAIRNAAPDLKLWAKPNAGLPSLRSGVAQYDLLPGEFADWAVRFASIGASVFGGCCGTTPEHIRAAACALGRNEANGGVT